MSFYDKGIPLVKVHSAHILQLLFGLEDDLVNQAGRLRPEALFAVLFILLQHLLHRLELFLFDKFGKQQVHVVHIQPRILAVDVSDE